MAPSAVSPEREPLPETLAALTAKFDDTLRFYLNGTKVVLDEIDPEVTVLEYLRGIGLTGTKLYVALYLDTCSSSSLPLQMNCSEIIVFQINIDSQRMWRRRLRCLHHRRQSI